MEDTGLDFADLVDEAVQRSGGETATASDVLKIRRSLRILTERWTAQGFNTWRIKTMVTQIAGLSSIVMLPSTVDDVIQVNSVRSGSKSETPMRRIPASEYGQLTTKQTHGDPSMYWFQRTESPILNIFPIGSPSNEGGLSIMYVERPAAFQRYGNVDDIPSRWLEALVTGLALDLARKRPPFDEALIGRLKAESAEAEVIAQRADRDRSNYRHRIG